ncbi:MAG: DUF4153 domain-containing protein [Gemmatimonadales bacterium]
MTTITASPESPRTVTPVSPRLGVEVLGTALVLGIAGDALLRGTPWGLNVTLSTALLIAAAAPLIRRHRITIGPDVPWLAITALLLALAFVRRDAETLAAFDVIALLVTLALGAACFHGERITTLAPWRFVGVVLRGGLTTAVGSLPLLGRDIPWHELGGSTRARRLRAVLVGVLLAAPLLVVFGALFAAADMVFDATLASLFAVDLEDLVSHALLVVVLAALAAGYLRWTLMLRPRAAEGSAGLATPGFTSTMTALGLLLLLFLMFVVIQLRYFFGGAALVERTTGLTYAEYARQGFFELVVASAFLLPVLLGALHTVRDDIAAHRASIRRVLGALLLLHAVIMTSAFARLRLYVEAFGLSEDRLYAAAVMVFLAGVFAWLAATELRGRGRRFTFGSLLHGYGVLAALHLLNPDAFITRTNLARADAGARAFDAEYAVTLGADAVPPLLEALPRLEPSARCRVVASLLDRWAGEDGDWRSWNWSRARARRLVRDQAGALQEMRCPTAQPSEAR